MSKEKVVFRTEKNPYMPGEFFLAAFPKAPANPGSVCVLPFYFDDQDRAVFEPFTEASYEYYYNSTKLVHKNTDKAKACLAAIEKFYETQFDVREKLTSRW